MKTGGCAKIFLSPQTAQRTQRKIFILKDLSFGLAVIPVRSAVNIVFYKAVKVRV